MATSLLAQTTVEMAMRTQVAIIGGGPAGLLLSHILDRNEIDNIVLERQSRQHVLQRIRAGVLEAGTVDLLRAVGLGERMDREGHPHDGSAIAWEGRDRFFIDTKKFTGKSMMAYGQTAITEDLYAARDAAGGQIIDEASNVQLHELTTGRAYVTYEKNGQTYRIDCDYIGGCDGYHGVSRHSIPRSLLRPFEKGYPFGWLGIMSETPPFPDLCYCYHRRGFALASMRSPMLSRYYIQCDLNTTLEDWPDERFWREFKARCPKEWPTRLSPAHRSKNQLHRCVASSLSQCAMAVCSWQGMRPTLSRRREQKVLTWPCRMFSICRALWQRRTRRPKLII
jgi:p-hydroxybenzoate 3-monooxygenase